MDSEKLNIIYAGTLEQKHRGLEWIPEIAKKLDHKVHFYIAGSGGLKNFFIKADKENQNITYLGPITHAKALALQKESDLIYGIYRSYLMNNVMAAPNKFYESTFVGTPIVINRGLYISEIIEKDGIGFVVEESEEGVYTLLKNLNKKEITCVAQKTSDYWHSNYDDYVHKKYQEEYLGHLAFFTNQ